MVILVGLRCAVAGRNLPVGSDGLSYLDVARAYLRHDWGVAVNGYWGPLYSWLLAATIGVVHPRPGHEFAALRGLNFLIFLCCLFAFARFWRSVGQRPRNLPVDGISLANAYPVGWIVLGYALFLAKTAWFVEMASPDLLVATAVLLIASELLKLENREQQRTAIFFRLGFLFALGFYSKNILFYFGIFVLAALTIRESRFRRFTGPIIALLVFCVLISPYVTALSHILGHLSFGESGRLNYAWFVDGTETGDWPNGGASFPFFPGSVLLKSPRVFKIPRLDGVTYAPWYDAARFDKRSHPVLKIRGQIRQLAINLKTLQGEILGRYSALLVCLIILIFDSGKGYFSRLASAWFCVIPVTMIIGMYLLVHLVDRFMIGFLLVLWGIAFSSASISPTAQPVVRRVILAGLAVFALSVFPGLLHYLVSPAVNAIEPDVVIAEALPEYGLRPGDSVGVIGDGQAAYWAHWGSLSVVAEISSMDSPAFWSSDARAKPAAVDAMKQSGAKAVVWRRDSGQPCPQGWKELPQNSGCITSPRVAD
jgi:hypothetical protein